MTCTPTRFTYTLGGPARKGLEPEKGKTMSLGTITVTHNDVTVDITYEPAQHEFAGKISSIDSASIVEEITDVRTMLVRLLDESELYDISITRTLDLEVDGELDTIALEFRAHD